MKSLLKIINNPLLLIMVIAAAWYATKDILIFTLVIMIFVTLQVVMEKIVNGTVAKTLFISWCLLMPLGTLTLVLRDPIFLQWKFSVIYWLFGSILIFSELFNGPPILKTMLLALAPTNKSDNTPSIDVDSKVWKKATYFMGFSLVIIGTINLYFIYFSNIETWVKFKMFGVPVLMFIIMSVIFLYFFSKSPKSQKDS